MGNSSGSSRDTRPIRPDLRPAFALLTFLLVFAAVTASAQTPDYLKAALARFDPNPPGGWAYTLQTSRNEQSMVERFDPSRPIGGQWTLRQLQGRQPTADELEKYARSRPLAGSGGTEANFQRDDIEPGSLKLIEETETQATYTATFREQSSGPDKMLGHLKMTLRVNKSHSFIEGYVLELTEPYWPVLGVKMNQLRIEARFGPPEAGRPSLPLSVESQFAGRILLFANEEKLSLIYSEFSIPAR